MTTRPRMIYLTHRVPYPPNRGDRIRTYHVLRFLAERADVHLGCLADEPVADITRQHLETLCASVTIVPISGWATRLRALGSLALGGTASEGAFRVGRLRGGLRSLVKTIGTPDAVVVSSSALAAYADEPGLEKAPLFVDLIDVDSQKWLDYAAASNGPKRWLYRTEGRRLRAVEQRLARRAEALFVVSRTEADLYRSFQPDAPLHAITNGVDLDYFQPPAQPGRDGCVFVGAMDYRPNADGVVWFCEHVWPEVRRQHPTAVFRIVGREPTPAVRALAEQPGVEVTGSVDDVRPYLAQAAVAVVPLHIARGVQNKVLEAMAMEKPVVCAPGPLQGVSAIPGEQLLAADTPQEWITAVSKLLDEPDACQRLGRSAGEWVRAHHTWEASLHPLATLLPFRNARTQDTRVPTAV